MSSESIYTFNASAIALGGVVNNPSRTVIPSLASVALAPTGGLGTTVVTGYNRDGVTFDTAYSAVRGELVAQSFYSTVAEVAIDNLTVFGTLHVDALRATVRSRRYLNSDEEAEITFQAEYSGLVIAGVDVAPELDLALFERTPTYEKFLAAVTEDGKKAKPEFKARFEWADSDVTSLDARSPKPVRASVAMPQHPFPGYRVTVPKFGKIRIGEVLLKPGRRRLSLLQIDFNNKEDFPVFDMAADGGSAGPIRSFALAKTDDNGSTNIPLSGTMTIASVEGNGTPIWPS